MSRRWSLAQAIFFPTLLTTVGAILLAGLLAFNLFKSGIGRTFQLHFEATQRLFSDHIAQDIISGAHAEVYRKCKAFLNDSSIKSIQVLDAQKNTVCDLTKDESSSVFTSIQSVIYFDQSDTNVAATVATTYLAGNLEAIIQQSLVLLLVTTFAILVFHFLVARTVSKRLSRPISAIAAKLRTGNVEILKTPMTHPKHLLQILEVEDLVAGVEHWSHQAQDYQSKLIQVTQQAAMADLAAQVAHDIRSPLAALEAIAHRLDGVSNADRVFIRDATNRIRDIANELLKKNAKARSGVNLEPEKAPTALGFVPSLIDQMISEKRVLYRSHLKTKIDFDFDSSAYSSFARIEDNLFKRILSNLIDNAVESIDENGEVRVALRAVEGCLEIEVCDNGRGIPSDILAKLGEKGGTYGKVGGTGLGLYHAVTTIKAWGGSLSIQSQPNSGTRVSLRLPRAPAPHWFVSVLELSLEPLVVFDDDINIRNVWHKRIERLGIGAEAFPIFYFFQTSNLEQWMTNYPGLAGRALYLVDYELTGCTQVGLDVIENNKLEAQSVLVTSRFDDPEIIARCSRMNVKILPKWMVDLVPIQFTPGQGEIVVVLIDDDELVHLTWKHAARTAGVLLHTFSGPGPFLEKSHQFDRLTSIYIDSNLGQTVRGEVVAEKLAALGFKKIYLTTGYEPSSFSSYPFLAGIIGKEPPF